MGYGIWDIFYNMQRNTKSFKSDSKNLQIHLLYD